MGKFSVDELEGMCARLEREIAEDVPCGGWIVEFPVLGPTRCERVKDRQEKIYRLKYQIEKQNQEKL
jgi:hypothetical protein